MALSAKERKPGQPVRDNTDRKPTQSKAALKRRRQNTRRALRLLVIMLCLFLATFLASALFTGNISRVSQLARGIVTPGIPKLVIRDAQNEYTVSPLSQKNTDDIRAFLRIGFEENQGVIGVNTESSAAAGLQSQSPFQRQLAKLNYSPQTLSVKQPLSQKITFTTPPTSLETTIFFLGDVYVSPSLEEVNRFEPENDGLCYVLVDAVWESDRSWQKTRRGMYCFSVVFDRPASFSVSAEEIDPGELLVFYAEYLMPGEAVSVQSGLPLSLQFSPFGRRQMIALAPIGCDIRPGDYTTVLSAGGLSQTFEITVRDKEFDVQVLIIDPQVAAETRNEATDKEFQDKINPVLAEQLPELLWQGKAALPVPEGRVLALFGSRRYVNDEVNSYRHTGLDLEAPAGTEVRAVNDGKVVFAEYLAYTGNTVLIEHGLGLKSWYYHMEEILVAPGDSVQKGDVIGLSGQTGFAAEPHLHLTMSVGDIHINPVTAINQPLFWEPLP